VVETTEEFLARGGKIEKIPDGVSGEPIRFNTRLKDRISEQKRKTYTANHKIGSARTYHLHKQQRE
jgi:hypothetical protein